MSHHHDHGHGAPGFRPSITAFFNNFRTYDAPLTVKLRLALRNTIYKIRTNSTCCGHGGEPGC